jgi:hypothetical protein
MLRGLVMVAAVLTCPSPVADLGPEFNCVHRVMTAADAGFRRCEVVYECEGGVYHSKPVAMDEDCMGAH